MTAQAPRTRRVRRRVDGVLLLDKPTGLSSNAALQRARRAYDAEKAGHTGTLDPLASGLLPLCFGEATKFAQFLLDATKRYTATVRFGVTTTTGDAEGEVLEMRPVALGALGRRMRHSPDFTGRLAQIPPAYSALKFEGRSHVRIRARRHRRPAPAARHRDPGPRAARVEFAGRRAGRPVQQGNLRARPGRGHRQGIGLRRASGGTAADRHRRIRDRRRRHARGPGGDGRRGPRRASCCLSPRCCATCRRCASPPPTRPGSGRAAPFRHPGLATARARHSRARNCWASPTRWPAWRSRAGWSPPHPRQAINVVEI